MRTRITTGKHGRTPRATHHIDASTLPNPHNEPWLRPRDGRDPNVQQWLLDQPGTSEQFARHLATIEALQPPTISITCSAGRHRSVALGEWLTTQLEAKGWNVQLNHHNLKTKKKQATTTQRGYGYRQQQIPRKNLLHNLIDGTECEYCARPMFRDPAKNFDGAPLEADHIDRDKTQPPKRLIHRRCNRTLNGKGKGTWVKHGPDWYAKHGQTGDNGTGDTLDWPGGHHIRW